MAAASAASEGASLEVRYVEPSLDLANLVACLADAVPVRPATAIARAGDRDAGDRSRPLLEWRPEVGTLAINTGAVLSRLPAGRRYRALQPGYDGGFVRDAPVPRTNARAYLGGRIVEGSGGALQQAVEALVAGVEAEIDAAITSGFDPALLAQPAERALRTIGKRLRLEADDFLNVQTRVRRTAMAPVAA